MDYSQVLEAPSGGFAQARAATRGRMRGALALFMATLCMLAALVGTAVAPQEAYAATCTVNFNIPANTVESNLSNIQKQGFGTLKSVTACIAYQSGKDTPLKITAKSTGGSVTDWGGYTTQKTLTVGSDGSITGSMSANESVIYLILCLTDTNGVVATTGYGADTKSTDGVTYERTGNQKSTSTSTIDLTSIDTSGLWLMTPTVTVTTDGNGSVSATGYLAEKSTGTYTVKVGNTLTLTATPAAGYLFKNWTNSSGAQVSTNATYEPTVNTNATYTANFEQAEASLTTSSGTTYGNLQDLAKTSTLASGDVITILKSGLERQNIPNTTPRQGLPAGVQVKSGVTTDKGVTITINTAGTDIAWDDSTSDGNSLPSGFHFGAEASTTNQSVTVSNDGTSNTRTMYAYTESSGTMVKVTSDESDFTLNSNASGSAGATVTGITAGKSVSIGKEGGSNTVTVTAKTADDTFTFDKDGNITLNSADSSATVPAGTGVTVGIDDGKSVTVPSSNTGDTVVTKKDNGGSEVTLAESGDAVTVNGVSYKAAADNTTIAFDKNGNPTLTAGSVTVPAGKSIVVNGQTVTAGTSPLTVTMNSDGTATVRVSKNDSVQVGDTGYTAGSNADYTYFKIGTDGTVTQLGTEGNPIEASDADALKEAIAAAPTNGSAYYVKLTGDCTDVDPLTIPGGANVILDLNGKTISPASTSTDPTITVSTNGALTVQDTSEDGTGKIVGNGNSTKTVGSDSITASDKVSAIYVDVPATLKIEGGTIADDAADGATSGLVAVYLQGASYVRGSVFSLSDGTIDGKLHLNDRVGAEDGSTTTISGGSVTGGLETDAGTKLSISGGTVAGTLSTSSGSYLVSGGTFDDAQMSIVKAALADGCFIKDNSDDTFTVKDSSKFNVLITDAEGNIVDAYDSLEDAIKAAESGQTVSLGDGKTLADAGAPTESVPLAKGASIKIGNNTFTATDGTPSVSVDGEGNIIVDAGATDTGTLLALVDSTVTVKTKNGESVPVTSDDTAFTVDTSNASTVVGMFDTDDTVTIGGTEYKAAADDTTYGIDEDGAVSLESGATELDPGESITVNGAGITAPDTNTSPIVVTANDDGSKSVTVQPGDSLTYTDANGNEHTIEVPADGEAMTFTVNEDGSITTPSLGDGESVIIDGVIYEGASDGENNKVTLGTDGSVTVDPDGQVNSADEQTVNDFIEKYATGEDGKVFTEATADNYEQILSGADAWNALSDGEKAIINDQLVANGGATFDELLAQAEALESATDSFIDKYLSDSNGNIYTKATRDNYAQILSGQDAWNALSQAEKDAINAKLVANGGKTYEELLASAQDIQKQVEAEKAAKAKKSSTSATSTSKTGDVLGTAVPIALAIALAAAAAGGYALTRRPRGKHIQR